MRVHESAAVRLDLAHRYRLARSNTAAEMMCPAGMASLFCRIFRSGYHQWDDKSQPINKLRHAGLQLGVKKLRRKNCRAAQIVRVRTGFLFALLLLRSPCAFATGPVIIDFESLRTVSPLAFSVGSTDTEDGFTLTAVPSPDSTNPGEFDFFGTLSNEFPGSTALLNCCGLNTTVLIETDGGVFDLQSIDL